MLECWYRQFRFWQRPLRQAAQTRLAPCPPREGCRSRAPCGAGPRLEEAPPVSRGPRIGG
eukprot:4396151-Prorocentrum_lima.AAC.1